MTQIQRTLAQQLAELKADIAQQMPAEVQIVMAQATTNLANSGMVNRSLNVGDRLPDIELPNATGKTVRVQDLLAQGPVVIAFYRGQWCPYCNLELRLLQQHLPAFKAEGATLLAISPQTPDNSLSTVEKHDLDFEVLSDVGNNVARQLGLVFTLPESLRPIYENFGVDLPTHNGDRTFELPVPATYVVAPDGGIVYAFADADYTVRAEPSDILAALRNLKIRA